MHTWYKNKGVRESECVIWMCCIGSNMCDI